MRLPDRWQHAEAFSEPRRWRAVSPRGRATPADAPAVARVADAAGALRDRAVRVAGHRERGNVRRANRGDPAEGARLHTSPKCIRASGSSRDC